MTIDFEAEGLLDGVEGDAREARRELLERLTAEGVSLEELREAVGAARLTLLPVERALAGDGPRYTPREVAELSGVELDLLQRAAAALGIPYPDPDDRSLTEAELEAARRVRAFLDAGLPEDGIVQVARTIGMGTARIAEANRELTVRTMMQPGDTERDLALRFAAAAEHLMPLIEPTLVYALRTHTLEQVRRDVIGAADLESGEIRGTADLTVCFADLVEFTRLGEEIAPEELGSVAGRFEQMAIEVAVPPVRLVKMIGDAAMLVSSEPEPLLSAGAATGRAGGGRRRGVSVRPGRPLLRDRPRPVRRLLRPLGQPREQDHRNRPAGQCRRRRRDQGGGRGRLHLHLHRRAAPEGVRLRVQAVPRPAGRQRPTIGSRSAMSPVSYSLEDGVATIAMDDGKVNVLSPAMLAEIAAALDRAEEDGAIVLITGREQTFSAGFDLRCPPEQAAEMIGGGAHLAERLMSFPAPVVAACNGNAIAMAAFMLLCSDVRVGVGGDFRIGLNEVAIGLTIPWFGISVARHRLARPYFDRCTVTGAMLDPEEAATAGFLDRLVEPDALRDAALEAAAELGALNRGAHRATKLRVREEALAGVRDGIERIGSPDRDW